MFADLKVKLDNFHTEVEYEDKIKKLLINYQSDHTLALGESNILGKEIL